MCFALVMYREARSEPIAAQVATAKILEHRATLNQNPACKELSKHRQFAWTRKYKIAPPVPVGTLDKAAWQQSQKLAKSLKLLTVKGITPNHIYFNTLAMGKRYKTKTKSVKIGGLIFY
jgi:spore germination cell wall hydrolase CwlJ-like protein